MRTGTGRLLPWKTRQERDDAVMHTLEPHWGEPEFQEALDRQAQALLAPPALPSQEGHLAWVLARSHQYDTDPRLGLTEVLLQASGDHADTLVREMRMQGWRRDEDDRFTLGELTIGFYTPLQGGQHQRAEGTGYALHPLSGRETLRALPTTFGVTHSTPVHPGVLEIWWTLVEGGTLSIPALSMAQELHEP